MLLYYITDRHQFGGSELEKTQKLLARIAEATRCGVDFIQLRERDLSAREVESLAREAQAAIRNSQANLPDKQDVPCKRSKGIFPRLLINSRLDVALAVGADGVHLRANDMNAGEARAVAAKVRQRRTPTRIREFVISAACHTQAEVRLAEAHGANLVLFGPVFEKIDNSFSAVGIQALRKACHDRHAANPPAPIVALGGVTVKNAKLCLRAGAAGLAGIRLFQDGNLSETVSKLRALEESASK